MAQVSIQYALDHQLNSHDVSRIKRELDRYRGVRNVSLNRDNGILCVNFDDHAVSKKQLEQCLSQMEYVYSLIDSITFLG